VLAKDPQKGPEPIRALEMDSHGSARLVIRTTRAR
jgi:hypothetical protein